MIDSTSSKLVWFPDSRFGFAIGKIVDIGQTNVTVQPVAFPSATSWAFQAQDDQPQPQQQQQDPERRNSAAVFGSKQSSKAATDSQQLEFPYKSVYPCDQFDEATLRRLFISAANSSSRDDRLAAAMANSDVDDSCALIELHEAALLENVRVRFHRDKIYTFVAHILIAVNPYFEIKGLHSAEAIERYQGKSLGTMPPHVYAIADKAFRDMKAFKQSQSIIISGESGAGKTESQKYVLRYLCLSGSQSGRLEKLILDANPLLEAFGNAKTTRNNNSSRFGKFIEIHYSQKFTVTGGLFFHYLLEKSRICTQSAGERNYHIFYQLCACLPDQQWRQLELGPPDQFHYLRNGCTQYFCSSATGSNRSQDKSVVADARKSQFHLKHGSIQDQLIDDLECYKQTDLALTNFGLSGEQKLAIYSIVAAVLHLGNISFVADDPDDNRGGCRIDPRAEPALRTTSRLIGLEVDLLRQALVSRIMSTARGGNKGTVYMVQLSVQQAQAARDALAKAIYSKLFDYIVSRIVNRSIPFDQSAYYIGVLDVAGFEYFQHNSFEQFLINFCNEKLQQFFNERILKEEQNIYEQEGLNLERVEFSDNQDCIQLFELRSRGIFDLLDEESRLPKPTAQHFTQSVHDHNKQHFRLALPRTSKLRLHRELRDDEGFLIKHFAGAVCYETQSFIEKNNDALHASLKSLMLEADNQLLCELFSSSSSQAADSSSSDSQPPNRPSILTTNFSGNNSSSSASSNKLNFISVGSTFRLQLNELMQKLRSTGSHFIRCIKPNSEMVAHKFNGGQILSQLHCSGMDSVLRLMQQGYPSRSSFNDLYAAYAKFLPPKLARLDSHLFCRALFKAIGLSDQDFRFGSSKVFFRPAKFAEFDQLIRTSDGEHVARLVEQVQRWLVCARWRKAQYCSLSAIKLQKKILWRREQLVNLQKYWRAALVRRQLRFRLQAVKQAQQIDASLAEYNSMLASQSRQQLPERAKLEQESQVLRSEIAQFIQATKQELQQGVLMSFSGGGEGGSSGASLSQAKLASEQKLDQLRTKRDLLVRSTKDRIAKQREQLAQLEQQMVEERRQREAEELEKRRDEQIKRERAELELRRQAEVRRLEQLEAAASENNNRTAARKQLVDSATDPISLVLASSISNDDQEQRDYEIALRLAQDNHEQHEELGCRGDKPAVLAPSENLASAKRLDARFDLTKWKYSDLRDTINTSCDLELLEACKREFHRRLKVYHAWRAMNSRNGSAPAGGNNRTTTAATTNGATERAPLSVMMNQRNLDSLSSESSLDTNESSDMNNCSTRTVRRKHSSSSNNNNNNNGRTNEQRYFRIPFLKQQGESTNGSSNQRGWWFAHFDGQWIARQLELHPNREPILLVAGQHDIDMCELSLNETRLTSKRGAEILAREFELEWQKYGGQPLNEITRASGGS